MRSFPSVINPEDILSTSVRISSRDFGSFSAAACAAASSPIPMAFLSPGEKEQKMKALEICRRFPNLAFSWGGNKDLKVAKFKPLHKSSRVHNKIDLRGADLGLREK